MKQITRRLVAVLLCMALALHAPFAAAQDSGMPLVFAQVLITMGDGSQQTIEVHPTKEGIEKLQSLIDERRAINVLELGWFHNKLANKLSKLYERVVS